MLMLATLAVIIIGSGAVLQLADDTDGAAIIAIRESGVSFSRDESVSDLHPNNGTHRTIRSWY